MSENPFRGENAADEVISPFPSLVDSRRSMSPTPESDEAAARYEEPVTAQLPLVKLETKPAKRSLVRRLFKRSTPKPVAESVEEEPTAPPGRPIPVRRRILATTSDETDETAPAIESGPAGADDEADAAGTAEPTVDEAETPDGVAGVNTTADATPAPPERSAIDAANVEAAAAWQPRGPADSAGTGAAFATDVAMSAGVSGAATEAAGGPETDTATAAPQGVSGPNQADAASSPEPVAKPEPAHSAASTSQRGDSGELAVEADAKTKGAPGVVAGKAKKLEATDTAEAVAAVASTPSESATDVKSKQSWLSRFTKKSKTSTDPSADGSANAESFAPQTIETSAVPATAKSAGVAENGDSPAESVKAEVAEPVTADQPAKTAEPVDRVNDAAACEITDAVVDNKIANSESVKGPGTGAEHGEANGKATKKSPAGSDPVEIEPPAAKPAKPVEPPVVAAPMATKASGESPDSGGGVRSDNAGSNNAQPAVVEGAAKSAKPAAGAVPAADAKPAKPMEPVAGKQSAKPVESVDAAESSRLGTRKPEQPKSPISPVAEQVSARPIEPVKTDAAEPVAAKQSAEPAEQRTAKKPDKPAVGPTSEKPFAADGSGATGDSVAGNQAPEPVAADKPAKPSGGAAAASVGKAVGALRDEPDPDADEVDEARGKRGPGKRKFVPAAKPPPGSGLRSFNAVMESAPDTEPMPVLRVRGPQLPKSTTGNEAATRVRGPQLPDAEDKA